MQIFIKPNKKILISSLLSGVAVTMMWACGPWFPDWLLTQGDQALLKPPTTHFQNEMEHLAEAKTTMYRTVPAENGRPKQTLDKALEDLREALTGNSVPEDKIKIILQDHQSNRKKVQEYREDFERYDAVRSSPWLLEGIKIPSFSVPNISEDLPEEFSGYFRGAIAYHQDRPDQARKIWEDLLKLPAEKRPFRSTWAVYMLGRLDVDEHPERAIQRFQEIRNLVDQGFKDSLGLAAASLGWEARAWFRQKQYRKSIELYLEQIAGGEELSAHVSIRWVIDQAFDEGQDALENLAGTPEIRRIVTAYLASVNQPYWDWSEEEDLKSINNWLNAIEKANAQEDSLFEPLALAVYQRGLFDLCDRLLEKAPADGVLTTWLKSKLLFRKGKIEDATEMLAIAAKGFPLGEEQEPNTGKDLATPNNQSTQPPLTYRTELVEPSSRARGEWGILLLHRGEYVQSMDTLLRSGYWMDAAYVAERVLNIEELKEYVDENWPAEEGGDIDKDFNPEYPPTAWSRWAPEYAKNFQVRYLLARRLARADRNQEAAAYYPKYWRVPFEKRINHLRIGYDPTQPKDTRAQALWEAAKLTRYVGLELIGTELGPDWAIHDGNFEVGLTVEDRQSQENALSKPSLEEIKRAIQTRLDPYERFHYRFLAANIAWDALKLMPDNDINTARHLCEAGGWIKGRDPKAADRFYKALVNRCPKTEIGKVADQLRWFPKLDGLGNVIKEEPKKPEEDSDLNQFHSL